jgi:arginase
LGLTYRGAHSLETPTDHNQIVDVPMRRIAIVEAPSILGLRPTGVETLPAALDHAGLIKCLGARRAGRVEPAIYRENRDPETGFLNAPEIADFSRRLAAQLDRILDAGDFPLVLGGDCSILIGSMLALHRRGRHGLLFLDGHMDFYQAEANVNGEAASSELALVTGRGPTLLTTYDGRCPLVADEDVVAFGFRDEREADSFGSQPLPRALKAFSLTQIRGFGAEAAARQAIAHVSGYGSRGYWVHFDADVLDDAIMPAVDYRMLDGLTWTEIEAVLRVALHNHRAVGMDITILNPTLDSEGKTVRTFVEMLSRSFAAAANV